MTEKPRLLYIMCEIVLFVACFLCLGREIHFPPVNGQTPNIGELKVGTVRAYTVCVYRMTGDNRERVSARAWQQVKLETIFDVTNPKKVSNMLKLGNR